MRCEQRAQRVEKGEHMGNGCEERAGNDTGELRCDGVSRRLNGRTLRLTLWLTTHQARINAAGECGQLWLTWKGEKGGAERTISGDLRIRL